VGLEWREKENYEFWMMKDEIGSAEPPQWQRWTGWSENEQVPLASRERRGYKASICATREESALFGEWA